MDTSFHLLMLALDGAALLALRRWPRPAVLLAMLAVTGCAAWLAAVVLTAGASVFALFRLLTYGAFVHLPILGAGAARILRRRPWVARSCLAAAVGVAGLAVWTLWIEPRWLEVSRVEIASSKLAGPLRLAVVADIQTDAFGDYERRALRATLEAEPDLILMPGDYLQIHDPEARAAEGARLRSYLREIGFDAPLGAYAVRGDMETRDWESLFAGTRVRAIPDRSLERPSASGIEQIRLTAGLTLTALSPRASRRRHLRLPPSESFHVVFGHAPDFALGDVPADLLIAGHTHGGQVRLPFLGPLVTFSSVPRDWAAGVTDLGGGRTLVVSRGIGMERGSAPQIRFRCRPEIVLIDLLPRS